MEIERPGVNIIDAAARGAGDGLQLALNIAGYADRLSGADRDGQWRIRRACTLAFIGSQLSCRRFWHCLFAPVAWLLGVAWNDCATIGNLLGHAHGAE